MQKLSKVGVLREGDLKMNDLYMPTDMQYKGDLRKQRDNWLDIMSLRNENMTVSLNPCRIKLP